MCLNGQLLKIMYWEKSWSWWRENRCLFIIFRANRNMSRLLDHFLTELHTERSEFSEICFNLLMEVFFSADLYRTIFSADLYRNIFSGDWFSSSTNKQLLARPSHSTVSRQTSDSNQGWLLGYQLMCLPAIIALLLCIYYLLTDSIL